MDERGELTTRDDFKDSFASPRLYYPGMLLSLSSGDGSEHYVTVVEVRDHKGPWVTLVYRPTTRIDRVWDWFRQRRTDVMLWAPAWLWVPIARALRWSTVRRAAIWTSGDDDAK